MSNNSFDQAYEDTLQELQRNIEKFKNALDAGTKEPENFITISEIERLWSDMNKSTSKAYSDMVSAYLSTLDEKAVIKAKKQNTKERGLV